MLILQIVQLLKYVNLKLRKNIKFKNSSMYTLIWGECAKIPDYVSCMPDFPYDNGIYACWLF